MFVLRALMVGFAFFCVCYCALSLLVVIFWQGDRLFRRDSGFRSARFLFALRVFPVAASVFITLILALPAFFLLEGTNDEDLGTLIFGLGALLLLAAAFIRVAVARFATSRLLAEWLAESKVLDSSPLAPTLLAKRSSPPLLLYGTYKPKVLVSETTISLLSREELEVAIRHELSHLRFRDNLKKLVLYGIPFPGLGSLERAWQEAAELAADKAAVSTHDDALNLAAALIKLCRLAPVQQPPALTVGLVELTALVDVRVRRLLDWQGTPVQPRKISWQWFPLQLMTVAYGISSYPRVLVLTHRLTEWFIR